MGALEKLPSGVFAVSSGRPSSRNGGGSDVLSSTLFIHDKTEGGVGELERGEFGIFGEETLTIVVLVIPFLLSAWRM
jgi:hypothetical protein